MEINRDSYSYVCNEKKKREKRKKEEMIKCFAIKREKFANGIARKI